jgi:hypothetical protein
MLVNSKSEILEATSETGEDKQEDRLRDQRSPERLNTLFDCIENRRVDIKWMERREFEI